MNASYFIHPSSFADDGCSIGAGTAIWHFCHIMPGAVIGNNCIIGQNVFIGNNAILGNNVRVQNNVSIYDAVVCEDDVFLGPGMVLTNVINPRSHIPRKNEFKPTIIRRGASIGANATIVCGNEIGSFAFIGAGAVVTTPVLAYALIVGNPGRQKGWMSEAGHKLLFDLNKQAVCAGTGQPYILANGKVSKFH